MIEILINNQKLDLSDDIQLNITYQSTDVTAPANTKNEYSKSITVKGTPNNNRIFGYYFDLNKNDYSDFNAKARIDATILVNGNILQQGYIQLTDIQNSNGIIQYTFTFYGLVGDFFYNLQYDEDGNDLSMADLYYGFWKDDTSTPLTIQQEKNNTICQWNSKFILKSWNKLNSNRKDEDMSVENWVTAAPTYSGMYDDFDNAKVMVNTFGIPSAIKNKFDIGSGTTEKDCFVVEVDRDMDEWECKDLRAVYQRPAIKTQLLLEAISNPENNGGYTVEWDANFKKSPYWTDSYTVMNRLDFSNSDAQDAVINIQYQNGAYPDYYTQTSSTNAWIDTIITDTDGNSSFNLSSYIAPVVKLNITPSLSGIGYEQEFVYTTFTNNVTIAGGIGYALYAYNSSGVELTHSPYYWVSTSGYAISKEVSVYKDSIATLMSLPASTSMVVKEIKPFELVVNGNGYYYAATDSISIQLNLERYAQNGVKLVLKTGYFYVNPSTLKTDEPLILYTKDNNRWRSTNFHLYSDFSSDGTIGIFDGNSKDIQASNVTKDILFASAPSPYNFLLSFCKQFNLRFLASENEKKIQILLRKDYYIDEIVDIDDKIDRNKNINITPTLAETKWYQWALDTPETYAEILYNRKHKQEYGLMKYNTNYYFNSEIEEVLEDNEFKNVIHIDLTI